MMKLLRHNVFGVINYVALNEAVAGHSISWENVCRLRNHMVGKIELQWSFGIKCCKVKKAVLYTQRKLMEFKYGKKKTKWIESQEEL